MYSNDRCGERLFIIHILAALSFALFIGLISALSQ